MSKEAIKKKKLVEQEGICPLSDIDLSSRDLDLIDTHRNPPKVEGTDYTSMVLVSAVDPVAHMKAHGTYRERTTLIEEIKSIIDDRNQTIKLRNKINNQLLACSRRTDAVSQDTIDFLKEQLVPVELRLKKCDQRVSKWIRTNRSNIPLLNAVVGVKGVGDITAAYLISYIDLDPNSDYYKALGPDGKMRKPPLTPSSLWKYCGYDKASHERYTKGVAGGGNKTLRTALYNTAESMIRSKSPYSEVYYNVKKKLEASEVITRSRNTKGILVETAWKDTKPGHRHGSAMRIMIKHFLADYWFVGRTLLGLPTRPLYVEEKLGHTGIIKPEERGWVY